MVDCSKKATKKASNLWLVDLHAMLSSDSHGNSKLNICYPVTFTKAVQLSSHVQYLGSEWNFLTTPELHNSSASESNYVENNLSHQYLLTY